MTQKKTVINLPRNTLNKGLKFAIIQREVPTLELITEMEEAAQKNQPPGAAKQYRWKTKTGLERTKQKNETITISQIVAPIVIHRQQLLATNLLGCVDNECF